MKHKIRKEKIKLLQEIPDHHKNNKNQAIFYKMIQSEEYKNAKTIFIYIAMPEEVETQDIIEHALNEGKKIYVPKVDLANKHMYVCPMSSYEELEEGAYGILEPCRPIEKMHDFDLMVIPGVAFDKEHNRLGRGGGYYDKFLNKSTGKKVAICYSEQLHDDVPVEEHDVKMDKIITD